MYLPILLATHAPSRLVPRHTVQHHPVPQWLDVCWQSARSARSTDLVDSWSCLHRRQIDPACVCVSMLLNAPSQSSDTARLNYMYLIASTLSRTTAIDSGIDSWTMYARFRSSNLLNHRVFTHRQFLDLAISYTIRPYTVICCSLFI